MSMTAPRSAGICAQDAGGQSLAEPAAICWDAASGAPQISRWLSESPTSSHAYETLGDYFMISVCLRATRLEIRTGASAAFDGAMRGGTLHITGPGQRVVAEMRSPCDLFHFHVPAQMLRDRLVGMGGTAEMLVRLAGCTLSDPLVEQLARLLLAEGAGSDAVYARSIAQTLLTRVLHMSQNRSPVGALPKWRLRRVQMLVDSRLAEPLTLNDLAGAAGLSRMHFAAQFRAATGSTPHEYLLCQRIETAKSLLAGPDIGLAEIALSVGFLGQAHFTTVFKRLTGETPARWRGALRDVDSPDGTNAILWQRQAPASHLVAGAGL